MNQLPAVLVGGPPHSGKSVLVYSLTQALRGRGIEHYALRACPDSEGDYSQEAGQETVRQLRNKGGYTPAFVQRVTAALAHRLLPLLVDVGGKPTAEQETMFDHCTHAILVSSTPEGLDPWRALAQRHGLAVIAELRSTLDGDERIDRELPVLTGVIHGLERGRQVAGPVLQALVARLATLLAYPAAELRGLHLRAAPAELVAEVDRMGRSLGLEADAHRWQPEHLPLLLDYLPAAAALALYGRAPNWVYTAAALHAHPAQFYSFDPRLGWVTPLAIPIASGSPQPGNLAAGTGDPEPPRLRWSLRRGLPYAWVDIAFTREHYLDYAEMTALTAPTLAAADGLVLSGKLPYWLLAGLALAYWPLAPWLAVYYPPLDQAVVVASRTASRQPGHTLAAAPGA